MVKATDIAGEHRRRRMVKPRYLAGNTEEEWRSPEKKLGIQKNKNGETKSYSWVYRRIRMVKPRAISRRRKRRKRRMVKPRYIAGNEAEEEEGC